MGGAGREATSGGWGQKWAGLEGGALWGWWGPGGGRGRKWAGRGRKWAGPEVLSIDEWLGPMEWSGRGLL